MVDAKLRVTHAQLNLIPEVLREHTHNILQAPAAFGMRLREVVLRQSEEQRAGQPALEVPVHVRHIAPAINSDISI